MCACILQSDRFQSGISADIYRSDSISSSQKSPPSSFSSFQLLQKQRPPPDQHLATQADGDLLLGALRQYLSGHLSLPSGVVSPSEQDAPSLRLRPFYSNGIGNSGLKKESAKSRLLKMGRTQGASAKDPLTTVDGACFLSMMDLITERFFVLLFVVESNRKGCLKLEKQESELGVVADAGSLQS